MAKHLETEGSSHESDSERAEEKKRFMQQDALRMLSSVQEMMLLDADKIKKDDKTMAILAQTRDVLDKFVGDGKMTAKDAEEAVGNLGFGPQKKA